MLGETLGVLELGGFQQSYLVLEFLQPPHVLRMIERIHPLGEHAQPVPEGNLAPEWPPY